MCVFLDDSSVYGKIIKGINSTIKATTLINQSINPATVEFIFDSHSNVYSTVADLMEMKNDCAYLNSHVMSCIR